jgi:hypothetical protein
MSLVSLAHHFLYCPVLIGREESSGEDYITSSFNFCTPLQILFERLDKEV